MKTSAKEKDLKTEKKDTLCTDGQKHPSYLKQQDNRSDIKVIKQNHYLRILNTI